MKDENTSRISSCAVQVNASKSGEELEGQTSPTSSPSIFAQHEHVFTPASPQKARIAQLDSSIVDAEQATESAFEALGALADASTSIADAANVELKAAHLAAALRHLAAARNLVDMAHENQVGPLGHPVLILE